MPTTLVTNSNAYKLWAAGAIAATNANPTMNWLQTTPAAIRDEALAKTYGDDHAISTTGILSNLALKGGFNAVRVFLPFGEYKIGAQPDTTDANGTLVPGPAMVEHDITTLARVGWADATVARNIAVKPGQNVWDTDAGVVPRYSILAAQIDNLLELCKQSGMGLILSLPDFYSNHGAGKLWSDAATQASLVSFWRKTAQKWVGKAGLIAYELINEPTPPDLYADIRNGTGSFKGLMEQCVAAIRQYDTVTPIIVSGPRGSDPSAFDFFLDADGGKTGVNLIKDTSDKIVYTCHFYSPTGFCNQGIGRGTYHLLGTNYPDIIGVSQTYTSTGALTTGITTRDFRPAANGTGMADIFANVKTFKSRHGKPVFLGEFSASSTFYYRQVIGAKDQYGASISEGLGALRTSTPTSADRAIYGLYYCATTKMGYMVLREPIGLMDMTEADTSGATGLSAWRPVNRVNIEIKAYNNADLGPFANLTVAGVLNGVRRWQEGGAWQQDNEFLISFPWPNASPPTSSVQKGESFYWGYIANAAGVLTAINSTPSPFVNADGSLMPPSGIRVAFQNFGAENNSPGTGMANGFAKNADGSYKLDASGNKIPTYAAKPTQLASIKIMLTDAQVQRQEASRVTFARDVLRQCATLGMSWAWFADTDIKDTYLWGDKFWTVDHVPGVLPNVGGNLRAMLKRAANLSYA